MKRAGASVLIWALAWITASPLQVQAQQKEPFVPSETFVQPVEAFAGPLAYGDSFCDGCSDGYASGSMWGERMGPWYPYNSVRVEYLMWWTRGRNTPALVTRSPNGTPRDEAGVINQEDTEVLYGGDESIGDTLRSGARITYSHLLGDDFSWLDVRFWGVEDKSDAFFDNSDGSPILARPFFNVQLGQQDALLLAFPGVSTNGNVRVVSKNDLIGADASIRQCWFESSCAKVDGLIGYQFTRMDDSLSIESRQSAIDPLGSVPVGTQLRIFDSFRTQNEFHGGHIGFVTERRHNEWTLEVLGRVAMGDMRQAVIIDGRTVTQQPNVAATTSQGGLLTLGTNIGQEEHDHFAFIPELNVNIGYDINAQWRLMMGYSFIYWNNVVLAGDQIDRGLNLSQQGGPLVGEARPQFNFNRSDYWVQGLSFGGEFRW